MLNSSIYILLLLTILDFEKLHLHNKSSLRNECFIVWHINKLFSFFFRMALKILVSIIFNWHGCSSITLILLNKILYNNKIIFYFNFKWLYFIVCSVKI